MNVLLIYPHWPETYWSFRHALKLQGKRAAYPPPHTSDPRNSSSHSKGARGGTMAKAARREALTLTWVSSYSVF